jgi:hypothetical protein
LDIYNFILALFILIPINHLFTNPKTLNISIFPSEFTCKEGEFLDIDSDDQACQACPAGTYSMGGGVRYDDWDHLPAGFSARAEQFSPMVAAKLQYYGMDMSDSHKNCSK